MKTRANTHRSAIAIAITLLAVGTQAEKRLVVGALDNKSHFSYTFKGEAPLFSVKTDKPKLPKTVAISNDTGRDIKVHFFNASDNVRAVPKRSATLKPGRGVSWPYQLYHVKVYEPKLIDKHVLTKLDINGDVVITRKGDKYTATVSKVPRFTVANNSNETILAYIYNEGDNVRLVARKSFRIAPKNSAIWTDPTIETFRVRIHRAKFLSKPISEARNANVRTIITVDNHTWAPFKKLMLSESKNGRMTQTSTPKVVPSLDGITSSPEGYFTIGNKRLPQIYALAENGALFVHTMNNQTASDGIMLLKDSADWELRDQFGDLKPAFAGQFGSTPAIVSDGAAAGSNMDLVMFARGPFGNVVTKRMYSGTNTYNTSGAWTDLSGLLDSRPAAVSIPGGNVRRLMVAIRDAGTNTLRVVFRSNDKKWGQWQDLGGNLKGSPAACAGIYGKGSASNRVDVFARGADDTLRHRAWLEGEGWQAWKNLGGKISSDPAVCAELETTGVIKTTTGKTILHVTALCPAGNIVYRNFDGSAWSDWKSLGGNFTSAPVVFLSDDAN